MRAFPVRLPSGARYWTVLDEDLVVVPVADGFLRQVRFGRDGAESTTKSYAHSIALFLRWCARTGRTWQAGAGQLGLFMTWLAHAGPAASGAGASAALTNDPRFISFSNLPASPVAPPVTRPNTPFFDGFEPIGNQTGETNYLMAKNFKIPYAYVFSFGLQRDLPGNFMLEADYVGRFGHGLWSQADAAQIVDFRDNTSGQFMLDAFNKLQQQIIAATPSASITAQPWFENQMNAAIAIGIRKNHLRLFILTSSFPKKLVVNALQSLPQMQYRVPFAR